MKRPCEIDEIIFKDNGCAKRIKTYSYVAVLTQIDGDEVKAVRYDGYTSKFNLQDAVKNDYPDWNLKGVWKLYDDDFRGGDNHGL